MGPTLRIFSPLATFDTWQRSVSVEATDEAQGTRSPVFPGPRAKLEVKLRQARMRKIRAKLTLSDLYKRRIDHLSAVSYLRRTRTRRHSESIRDGTDFGVKEEEWMIEMKQALLRADISLSESTLREGLKQLKLLIVDVHKFANDAHYHALWWKRHHPLLIWEDVERSTERLLEEWAKEVKVHIEKLWQIEVEWETWVTWKSPVVQENDRWHAYRRMRQAWWEVQTALAVLYKTKVTEAYTEEEEGYFFLDEWDKAHPYSAYSQSERPDDIQAEDMDFEMENSDSDDQDPRHYYNSYQPPWFMDEVDLSDMEIDEV